LIDELLVGTVGQMIVRQQWLADKTDEQQTDDDSETVTRKPQECYYDILGVFNRQHTQKHT